MVVIHGILYQGWNADQGYLRTGSLGEYLDLVYRLLNTPLEQTEHTREYEHILNMAVTNGFDKR